MGWDGYWGLDCLMIEMEGWASGRWLEDTFHQSIGRKCIVMNICII